MFDGTSGQLLNGPVGSFYGFEKTFFGGEFVAASDVNGDGRADIIVGSGSSNSLVRAYSGVNGSLLSSFFAYYPGFHGGVRVAAGDVNGDGRPDGIVGAGNGAPQKVRSFDGVSLAALDSFFADPKNLNGFFVAASR